MQINSIRVIRNFLMRSGVLFLATFILSACEVTEPGRAFLLRFPQDVIHSTALAVPLFTASKTSGESIHFEWEATPNAEEFEITFWRAVDADSMNQQRVDFNDPAFTIPVISPQVATVPFNPADPDDERELAVIQFDQPLSGLAEIMESAGLPADEELYFIWSVYAEGKGERWRSPENHRMRLIWLSPTGP